MSTGTLYLIPSFIGDNSFEKYLPEYNRELLSNLKVLAVENAKSARAFLKACNILPPYDEYRFCTLDKKAKEEEYNEVLNVLLMGEDVGFLSEAGMPSIADPGSYLAQIAHDSGLKVVPLNGPSSVFLALAASGLNGQQFNFHGYLPIREPERTKTIKSLEKNSRRTGTTHIFIETPYRNAMILEALVNALHPKTMLCMAAGLNSENEIIRTLPVNHWRAKKDNPGKVPAVWLFNAKRTTVLQK